jgi:DNA-binding GntR family transcriptional regulator
MTEALPPFETEGGEGLPLYLQVSATLRTAILRGIYPVGSRLPTEEELCQRFKVSRHTIREALRQLRADDLITSRPGSRPLVAAPTLPRPAERIGGDGGIGEDFFDYVIGTRLELAAMEMTPITRELAGETGLPTGEQWLCVTGYRTSIDSGRTTCWNAYYIDAQYAVVGRLLARHVGPLIPLLEDLFGKRITQITRAIAPVGMPSDHAERLGVAPGDPTLRIVTRCETADGRIAMVNRSLHPDATLSYTIKR